MSDSSELPRRLDRSRQFEHAAAPELQAEVFDEQIVHAAEARCRLTEFPRGNRIQHLAGYQEAVTEFIAIPVAQGSYPSTDGRIESPFRPRKHLPGQPSPRGV